MILTRDLTGLGATGPVRGECSADGQYIWDIAADGTGYFRRRGSNETCTTVGVNQVAVIDHRDDEAQAQITNADGTTTDMSLVPMIDVGPFKIPVHAEAFAIHWSSLLPAEWRSFINTELAHDCENCVVSSMVDATPGHRPGAFRDFLGPEMPSKINKDFLVRSPLGLGVSAELDIPPGQFIQAGQIPSLPGPGQPFPVGMKPWHAALHDLSDFNPIVLTKHPITGEDFGIYMWLAPRDINRMWDFNTNPFMLNLIWKKVDRSWFTSALGFIKEIISKLEDMFCPKMAGPAGAALATAGPYGAAAAVAASTLCALHADQPAAVLQPPPVAPTPWWKQWYVVIPVVVAGGLGVIQLTSKKKA